MATVKHAKQTGLPPDEGDPTHVEPSDWYAAHTVTLVDGDIPAAIARDAEVDTKIATHAGAADPHADRAFATAAVAAEATLARNADNLSSGTVADARIPSGIARDSEVTSAVAAEATARDTAIAVEAALARNADNLSSGTVADARIAATIARDSEVTSAVAAEATARDTAIGVHSADTTAVHGIADTANVVLTNDARLSDARTPTDASVTAAKVAGSLKPSGTAAAGDEALRALGTSASTAAAGNDSRLSDARTPSAHHTSHEDGGADEVDLTGLSGTPAALTTHAAAGDPHPGYLTPAEGNAAYDAAGAAAAVTTTSIGAVPTARTITAGTGLTGGGDLSANRTLAPDFGSGAGKVTQGNDSRLSDARTPTAHATSHKAGGSDDLSGVQNGFAPLSSGLLVPISYLGTGTPNGTKFLRDDGVFAVPAGAAVPTYETLIASMSGLVHRWKFEEASGNFADAVGSLTLTKSGTFTYSVAGGPVSGASGSVTFGASGKGLSSGLGSIPTGGNSRTFVLIFKGLNSTTKGTFASYGTSGSTRQWWTMLFNDNGAAVTNAMSLATWADDKAITNRPLTVETWHMAAFVYDGVQSGIVWLDGYCEVVRFGGALNTGSGGNFTIGQDTGGSSQLPAVSYDDLAVFSRALQPFELAQLYASLA